MLKLILVEAILGAASTYFRKKGDDETAKKLEKARKCIARFRATRLALKVINGTFKLKNYFGTRRCMSGRTIPFLPFLPNGLVQYLPHDVYHACTNLLPNVEFSMMQPYLCGSLESMQSFLPQQFDPSGLIDVAYSSCGWEDFFAGAGNLEGM